MHSLEPECRELAAAGVIDAPTAERAIALESGTLFSVAVELRFALYASVAAIASGVGLLVKNNLDRIGPVALSLALAVVAAACYAHAIRARLGGRPRSLGGDYVLLLGALILSADVGYAETQFHWLGDHWSWHLLILAAFHASCAYLFDSRLLLSVALSSLAGWFGIEARLHNLIEGEALSARSGFHALGCAALIAAAREVHQRLAAPRAFEDVYEQFALNIAFWGALALAFMDGTRLVGLGVLGLLATLSIRRGLANREESLVVYGVAYPTFGLCVVLDQLLHDTLATAVLDLGVIVAAALLLWSLHRRLHDAPA
jgi:hypothetical protein